MSAIAGYYHTDGNGANPALIDPMLDAMAHRSPDGRAGRCFGPVVLGFGAFSTTAEERRVREPVCLDKVSLVMDGRLDNRKELIQILGWGGENCPSDHELVIGAYRKWREACLERLEGVFSFALWDGTRLFCGRDRFGIKPFNYFYDGRFFAFASEAKGLFPLRQVDDGLDEEQLCLHFHTELKILDQEKTYFREVKRLPPARGMIVGPEGLRQFTYWQLDREKRTEYAREQDYYEHFAQLLRESVSHCLRSDRPVGSTLSGGLDSSSISCLARDILKEKGEPSLNTFSCLFNKIPDSDESEWIGAVEEQGGIISHHLHPDEVPPLDDMEAMIRLHEGPFFGPNYYIQKTLFSAAAARGHRILLDGEDGDGIVSHGYDFLVFLAQAGKWDRFFIEADGIVDNFGNEEIFFSRPDLYLNYGHPFMLDLVSRKKYLTLLRYVNRIHKSINLSRKRYVKLLFAPQPERGNPFFSYLKEDMVRKYRIRERVEEAEREKKALSFPMADNHYHYRGIVQSGNSYILEYLERLASHYGIESRHPFFNRKLAEYCLSLPSHVKLRNGMTRYHFREAMKGILPEKVRLRGGKGDLTPSAVRGFRHYHEDSIGRVLQELAGEDPLVDGDKVKDTRAAYIERKEDGALIDCWYLIAYGLWRNPPC